MKKLPRGIQIRNGSYVAYLTQDGKPIRKVVGQVGCITPKQAAAERAEIERQIREGLYAKLEQRADSFAVADLYEPYMTDFENRGGKDPKRWRLAWKHLKPHFGSLRVCDVTTAGINDYIAARKELGRANGTINRELTLLKALFRFGAKQTPPMVEKVPSFPTKLKEAAPRKGFVTGEQYRVLAANAKELWLRALIACAYAYGFRKGELLNLRVRQVDLLDRWLTLEVGTTKNDEGRKVKMTAEVFELMCACVEGKKDHDFVFTHEDGSPVRDPRKAWYSLCVTCGLGTLTPAEGKKYKFLKYRGMNLHDFRRAAVRNLVRALVPERVAMEISGHKTRSVFDRYNIVDEADLIRASKQIELSRQVAENQLENASKNRHETDTSSFESTRRERKPQ